MPDSIVIKALFFGLLSAVSMPLGVLTLKIWQPKDKIVAFLLAFGSGALLAALTLELVDETVKLGYFYQLAIGCILGSLLFIGLNLVVNLKGGFLRKSSTTINYMKREKARQYQYLFEKLSKIDLFRQLPAEDVLDILPYIVQKTFSEGEMIFDKGAPGDSLYIIEEGSVEICDPSCDKTIAELGAGSVLGEMALVTGEPRSAAARSKSDVKTWMILKEHFDQYLYTNPKIAVVLDELVSNRIAELKDKKHVGTEMADKWIAKAKSNINRVVSGPTDSEISKAKEAHSGSGFAIWLGNLLDCVPGGLVIGTSISETSVSIALIAGLMFSNYPEVISSSHEMRRQGTTFPTVFWMWTSLMLITGLSALFGNMFFTQMPEASFALIKGIAAGAMLTMVAETMLPEAYNKFSTITGFSTLLGFLAAIFLKTIE